MSSADECEVVGMMHYGMQRTGCGQGMVRVWSWCSLVSAVDEPLTHYTNEPMRGSCAIRN